MSRYEDWPERLFAVVETSRSRAFAWGSHDCALFACDCVLAITGTDPAAWFRGRYRAKRKGYALLKRFAGGGGLSATWEKIAAAHGYAEIAPAFAGRGDIVLLDTVMGEALGVSLGLTIAAAGPEGLEFLPLAVARRGWRI